MSTEFRTPALTIRLHSGKAHLSLHEETEVRKVLTGSREQNSDEVLQQSFER